jgi:hypothetical protein
MTVDLAIIGAGPAGMAAAALGAELGLDTLLIDEQDGPGGQIYRAVDRAPDSSPLGADYLVGRRLAATLRVSAARYRPAMTVWHIDPDGTLSLATDGISETVTARRILLATGAIERPVPIPGWTLPGVMTVGAAQILLKTADLVPEGRTVLAGQGRCSISPRCSLPAPARRPWHCSKPRRTRITTPRCGGSPGCGRGGMFSARGWGSCWRRGAPGSRCGAVCAGAARIRAAPGRRRRLGGRRDRRRPSVAA